MQVSRVSAQRRCASRSDLQVWRPDLDPDGEDLATMRFFVVPDLNTTFSRDLPILFRRLELGPESRASLRPGTSRLLGLVSPRQTPGYVSLRLFDAPVLSPTHLPADSRRRRDVGVRS